MDYSNSHKKKKKKKKKRNKKSKQNPNESMMSLNGQPQMPQHYKPNQIAPQFVAQGGFQPPIPPNNNRFAKDFGNGAPSMAKGMRMGGKGGTLAQTTLFLKGVECQ